MVVNDDKNTGEHSFISAFSTGTSIGLVWLDAQKQTHVHTVAAESKQAKDKYLGAIGLRYAMFQPEMRQVANGFIDPITCECCPTSAAMTAKGPVVVYRGRLAPTGVRPEDIRYETPAIRDITLVRFENGRWTIPRRIYPDDWRFSGCPDNGPAVATEGNRVAVAWWTGAGDQPHVSVAFSNDAGDTFGKPIRVNSAPAEGQVTVALLGDGETAVVGWLESHQTWARYVNATGNAGFPIALGAAPHHARLPRWIGKGDTVLAGWSEQRGTGARAVRMARIILR
jgi:hypothetical protein